MTNTKAQKQKKYIECLNTKDIAAYLESERKQKNKKLVQLKKDEAAYNLHLKKKKKKENQLQIRLRKSTNEIEESSKESNFHLLDELKAGHKASSLLDEIKIS